MDTLQVLRRARKAHEAGKTARVEVLLDRAMDRLGDGVVRYQAAGSSEELLTLLFPLLRNETLTTADVGKVLRVLDALADALGQLAQGKRRAASPVPADDLSVETIGNA